MSDSNHKLSEDKDALIFVAGHKGLVGSAVVRCLHRHGYHNLLLCDRKEVDLTNQAATRELFSDHQIEYVFLAAAKVGGIVFNKHYQADFLYENLMITANVIKSSADSGVKKLLNLGSSCIYPRLAPQPMPEDCLLTGPLEPTNEGYAIAKIAGLKLTEKFQEQYGKNFISAMPTNLYGINDNFHPEHSHVIPGLMRRFHEAKISGAHEVTVWGSGNPRREFLFVDDLAEALVVLMHEYNQPEVINIGCGEDVSIKSLAATMKKVVGFEGSIHFDASKPDGTPRKLLNVEKITNLGWKPKHTLEEGLTATYKWAVENNAFS